jgi:SAM-dependent methyltransferase
MLQLRTAGYKALDILRTEGAVPFPWNSTGELEERTDKLMQRFFEERVAVSKELGAGFLLAEELDRLLRTEEPELMDSENLAATEKLAIVRALDRQNSVMGLYSRYAALLLPLVRDIASRTQSRVRLLELAGGTGGLALALASEAQKQDLPLSVTGSDVVPEYIREAKRVALEKGLPVTFRLLDAFDMNTGQHETFDIILISQSLHHFTPGQLAVMIANAEKRNASAFVGIDGYRDLLLGIGMPLAAGLQGIPAFTLDGLTSARKFYSEPELRLIAETAVDPGRYAIGCSWPMTVLTVRFDGGEPAICTRFA